MPIEVRDSTPSELAMGTLLKHALHPMCVSDVREWEAQDWIDEAQCLAERLQWELRLADVGAVVLRRPE